MMESSKTLIVSPLSIDPPPNPMARISEAGVATLLWTQRDVRKPRRPA